MRLSAHLFNAIANIFYSEEILASIRQEIAATPSMRILDIPCGSGTLAPLCLPGQYHGADIDPDRVKRARQEHPSLAFSPRDVTRLDFEDGAFDCILAAGLFHHLDDRSADLALAEFARILKPGGKVVVFEAIWPRCRLNLPGLAARKMDDGKFVRHPPAYRDLFSRHFNCPEGKYPHRLILDYWLVTLTLPSDASTTRYLSGEHP